MKKCSSCPFHKDSEALLDTHLSFSNRKYVQAFWNCPFLYIYSIKIRNSADTQGYGVYKKFKGHKGATE